MNWIHTILNLNETHVCTCVDEGGCNNHLSQRNYCVGSLRHYFFSLFCSLPFMPFTFDFKPILSVYNMNIITNHYTLNHPVIMNRSRWRRRRKKKPIRKLVSFVCRCCCCSFFYFYFCLFLFKNHLCGVLFVWWIMLRERTLTSTYIYINLMVRTKSYHDLDLVYRCSWWKEKKKTETTEETRRTHGFWWPIRMSVFGFQINLIWRMRRL